MFASAYSPAAKKLWTIRRSSSYAGAAMPIVAWPGLSPTAKVAVDMIRDGRGGDALAAGSVTETAPQLRQRRCRHVASGHRTAGVLEGLTPARPKVATAALVRIRRQSSASQAPGARRWTPCPRRQDPQAAAPTMDAGRRGHHRVRHRDRLRQQPTHRSAHRRPMVRQGLWGLINSVL